VIAVLPVSLSDGAVLVAELTADVDLPLAGDCIEDFQEVLAKLENVLLRLL
jgi:hypothetical protein